MNDFNKFNSLDILISTPYDVRWNLSGYLTENIFFDELFVEHPSFTIMKDMLDDYLSSKPYMLPFFCFIEGYAGTGKTTFIHWYKKTTTLKMQHAIIDLAQSKSHTHAKGDAYSGEDLFENCFIGLLSRLFDHFPKEVIDVLCFIEKSEHDLTNSFSENFYIILREYFHPHSDPSITQPGFNAFINGIIYTEMILLSMLIYNKYPKIISAFSNDDYSGSQENRQLVLYIDNMDSMKMESRASRIPKEIATLYYQYYMPIIGRLSYFTDRKINFIFCMRDSVYSVVNPQHNDFFNLRHLHFNIKGEEAKGTYDERQKFASSKGVRNVTTDSRMLRYAYEDRFYLTKTYLPLFNYNIRKLAAFMLNASTEAKNADIEAYESLRSNRDSNLMVGARGIIFFLLIKCMAKRDFISNNLITKEGIPVSNNGEGLLNIARIILTIIHNKTHYQINHNNSFEHLNEAGLYEIYKDFFEVFQSHIDDFCDTLSSLFLFYEENWCHLITFKNIPIYNLSSVEDLKLLLYELEDYKAENNVVKALKISQELNNFKVRINSSGYIFLKDVIRHYEYHSIKAGNEKPLYACTKIIRDSNYKSEYEFILSIQATKNNAISCIKSLKSFLKECPISFEHSSCCFRLYSYADSSEELEGEFDHLECSETARAGQLLINRIIDTHTNYIDRFRLYILNNNELIEKYKKILKSATQDKIRIDINEKLCSVIRTYLDEYYIKNDNKLQGLVHLQKRNLENIIADAKKDKFQLSLNTDRNKSYISI